MIKAKNLSALFISAIAVFAMTVFLIFPARYAQSVSEGISLWAVNVLPATFPFLFLTALLSSLRLFARVAEKLSPAAKKLFRVNGAGGCAAVMSALSGYPVGARLLFDLHERNLISQNERFRLACLCSTSGPMFLVGVVGSAMFHSAKAGWIALLSHLLSVCAVCFCLRFLGKKETSASLPLVSFPAGKETSLYESLSSAVTSILCVGGFIALFYAFGQMLSDLGVFAGANALLSSTPFAPYGEGVLRGLLEMTTGCAILSQNPAPLSLALSCFLVTFGGLCVLCQQLSYLSRTGIKPLPFAAVKLIQAVVSAIICYLLALALGM